MNQMQTQVLAFHKKFRPESAGPPPPTFRHTNLRLALIEEELEELQNAVEDNDMVEAIDAIGDLLYVTFGACVEWGIDIEPYFNEIHRTNMAKTGGTTRADGKILKPEGWQPPRIAHILALETTPPSGFTIPRGDSNTDL